MKYRVKSVVPLKDFKLLLTFASGEKKIYNMRPNLKKGVFKELTDEDKFNRVRVSFDTIEWENGADIDPEAFYSGSELLKNKS